MHRAAIFAAAVVGLTPPAFAQEACPALSRDESIAIARQFHEEVINRRNPAVLDTILADTVQHHAAGGYPDEMDAAGVKAMMADFLDAFPDLAYSFDLWAVDGDLVVERYTATGTQEGSLGDLAPSGRKASWTGVNIFRIDCGRIVELWSEVDAVSRNRQLSE